jgi:hypothetical protein
MPPPPYTEDTFAADLFNAMQSRPSGQYSGRPLGNSANAKLWTPAKLHSLWLGVRTARDLFYRELSLQSFARLNICECMQESTGNYRLGVTGRPVNLADHASCGIIQVTPGSVLLDYKNWGLRIGGLDPAAVLRMDLSDPGPCVVLWAWYTRNCVATGVSFEEFGNRVAWNTPKGDVTRDVGNALFQWLAGPHNDRHHPDAHPGFDDYYKRILDYYTASGFGSKAQFDGVLATTFGTNLIGVAAARNRAAPSKAGEDDDAE